MSAADDRAGHKAVWYRSDRIAAIALFAAAAALVFPNLGDRCLWQDEAETALIAKNIIRTGLPLGWDGRQLVTQDNGQELSDVFIWAWTPWLQHYVAAFGMAVGGENSFGARWPFALLGCLSFPFFFLLVRRMTKDRFLAATAVVMLITSVQYLLLMRQCRYYALLPVLFLLCMRGYLLLPSRRGIALLSAGLVLFFYSNYVSCAIAATGFMLHAALFRRRDAVWPQIVLCGLLVGAGALPWIITTGFLDRASSTGFWSGKFLGTLVMSNRYVCPWLVLGGLGIGWLLKRLHADGILGLCACMLVPMLFFLPVFLWPNPRYIAFLLPVGALMAAKAVREVWTRNTPAGLACAALLIGTNVFVIPLPALIPAHIGRNVLAGEHETGADAVRLGMGKSELWGYAYEITHACRGPDEELVSYVNTHTAPDELVGISKDWLPVMFHTGRRIAGVVMPGARKRPGWDTLPPYLYDARYARWLILRPQFRYGPGREARNMLMSALRNSGVRVEKACHLEINDVRWINRPLLSKHVFRMPDSVPAGSGVDIMLLTRE